jgi:hypothetical protein
VESSNLSASNSELASEQAADDTENAKSSVERLSDCLKLKEPKINTSHSMTNKEPSFYQDSGTKLEGGENIYSEIIPIQ